ncbi:MAG: iron-containing redox enzyme family protein [Flavobacteriales bacterium]|nr:iron-containing redox enzyme family protein [Flavobacteriales bacterium]
MNVLPPPARVTFLISEAEAHRALHHPYLNALKEGSLPDPMGALQRFASEYAVYTRSFQNYLLICMSKLENQRHRSILLENLCEESGRIDEDELAEIAELGIQPDWVQGVPHPELFARFRQAIGAVDTPETGEVAQTWKELFIAQLTQASAAEALGALGLGTESIVKHFYRPLMEAIRLHTTVSRREAVFFELHAELDDEHGELMLQIAEELIAENPANYEAMKQGMRKALGLRSLFCDRMLELEMNR